jgi:hypothetical protein
VNLAKNVNMVLHQYNTASFLDNKVQEFWSLFKKDIIKWTEKSWKEEDYTGKSYAQWNVMQYHNTLSLIILMYLDIEKNKLVYPNWSYYNTKYKLDLYRKCLACANIDLDKVLDIFGLPFRICGEGIECMEIENTFIVSGIECGNPCIRVLEDGTPRETQNDVLRILEECV